MESPWPASLQDRFTENLSALKKTQPDVATLVENALATTSVALVTGRDGQQTFQLSNDKKIVEWLGASSMPSVSASEILSLVVATDVNAIIPGVVTGLEPLILLENFPECSAVFVIEPNPLLVKLVFHLYDYEPYFQTGRLIVVTGQDWVDQFCAFFETHPGYDLPTQMVSVPHCTGQQFALMQQHVERAGQTVFATQSQQLSRVKASLDAAKPVNLDTPRVVIIAADSRPAALEDMECLVRAAQQLGWTVASCRADVPSKRHPTHRLQCVQQINANIVISVGGWSQTLGQLLPAKVSTICWLTSSSALPTLETADISKIDFVVTPTARVKQYFESTPIDSDSLLISPPAINAIDEATSVMSSSGNDDSVDVVMVADLPDDRPESFGILLPSQLRLWQAMQDVATAHIKSGIKAASPDDMLADALKKSDIRLKERAISQQFATWLEQQILPARRAIATAEALQQAGIRMALYGWGWAELSDGHFQSVQDSCLQAVRRSAIARAKAIVVPLVHDVELQLMMESLRQAKPVICHGSELSFSEDYPELGRVSNFVDFYHDLDELVSVVQKTICLTSNASQKYADAKSYVLREHTWKLRLQSVVNNLVKHKQATVVVAG